jgi:tetratricopeptide (TPR) repeat protein
VTPKAKTAPTKRTLLDPYSQETAKELAEMIRIARSRALAVCEANEPVLRKAVLDFLRSELKGDGVTIQELEFTPTKASLVSALKDWADGLKKGKEKIAVSVEGLGESLDIQWRKESLRVLNQQRDFLLKFPHPVILWVNKKTMERIPIEAADFWVVRTGYFRFLPFDVQFEQATQQLSGTDYLFESKEEIEREIRGIKKVLKGARKKSPGAAALLHNLGVLYQSLGDYDEAHRLYEQSLEIKKEFGDRSGIAMTLHQLGMLAYLQGDYKKARSKYEESLYIAKELGNKPGIASTLHNMGAISQDQGDYAEARRLYEQSLEMNKELGDKSGIA